MPTTGYSFLAHRGRETSSTVEAVLRDFRKAKATARLGATVWLPRYRAVTTQQQAADFAAHANYVIADPETERIQRPFAERGRGRQDFLYLQESDPAANRARFVTQALQAQLQMGATALVSPWLVHGFSGTNHELEVTLDFATRAAKHPLVKGKQLLLGMCVTDEIIANDLSRNYLLDRIVDLPEAPVYFRMRINPLPGRQQYARHDALEGLKSAINSLDANERPVILPRSGLAGWLMMPFGARAFGAGIDTSMQRNLPLDLGGGGGQPPLRWYFRPQFLGFVQAEELPLLRKVKGFTECKCPYCKPAMGPGAAWDVTRAGQHFLWWCCELANELTGPSALGAVKKRLQAAGSFSHAVQGDGVPLDGRSLPRHLGVWSAVVT
jgi:hypothetical protein